ATQHRAAVLFWRRQESHAPARLPGPAHSGRRYSVMNPFTLILLRYLLRQRDTRETVQEWREAEPNCAKRVLAFATALEEDFDDLPPALANELLAEVRRQINWMRVAS